MRGKLNMYTKIILAVFCCLISLQVTKADSYDDYDDQEAPSVPDTPALANIVEKNAGYSNNFVKAISGEENNNYVSSPLSAWLALSMAYMGATGQTANVMYNQLNLPDTLNETTQGMIELMDNLNAKVEDVEIKIVNKVYVKEGSNMKDQYKEILENTFKVTPEERNFNDPNLPIEINNFVAQATNQKIKNLLPAGNRFDPLTQMVLLNAVYFKGLWDSPFEKSETRSRAFHLNERDIQVPTMKKEFNAKYTINSELGAAMVEIPYKGKKTSMLIVVPQRPAGLAGVEQKIRDRDINNLMKTGKYRNIRLFLPKFRIESSINLESTMRQMGLDIIFSDQAHFTSISDNPLKINRIRQKAYIQVDEESTEAAAVTDLGFIELSVKQVPRYTEVRVDQPFLFYILHRTTPENNSDKKKAVVLFNGRVSNPRSDEYLDFGPGYRPTQRQRELNRRRDRPSQLEREREREQL